MGVLRSIMPAVWILIATTLIFWLTTGISTATLLSLAMLLLVTGVMVWSYFYLKKNDPDALLPEDELLRRKARENGLVGVMEIAELAGVSSQTVCNWRTRHRDFPLPVVELRSGPVFVASEVAAWLRLRELNKEKGNAN